MFSDVISPMVGKAKRVDIIYIMWPATIISQSNQMKHVKYHNCVWLIMYYIHYIVMKYNFYKLTWI